MSTTCNSYPTETQIKQYTASSERGLQNQREHHIILTKYEVVHPTAVSENYSSLGRFIILVKVQTVCINSNNFSVRLLIDKIPCMYL